MSRARARVLWSGVDTLELFSRAPASVSEVSRLRALRANAVKRKRTETVRYGGEEFEIARRLGRHAALLLRNETMTVSIRPYAWGQRPRIVFELGSLSLACNGASGAVERARAVLAHLAASPVASPVLHVSRLDLAADVQGWAFRPSDLKRFHTRVRRFPVHDGSGQFTGFIFGQKALLGRLYDKTTEIAKSRKTWPRNVWATCRHYRQGVPVWRIEFQLRRPALRSFAWSKTGERLDTWEDVHAAIRSLWRRLTMDWLSVRLPRTGKTRRRYAPRWQPIIDDPFTNGSWAAAGVAVRRVAQRAVACSNAEALDRQILREVAVQRWRSGADGPLDESLRSVLEDAWKRITASLGAAERAVAKTIASFRSAVGIPVPAVATQAATGGGRAA